MTDADAVRAGFPRSGGSAPPAGPGPRAAALVPDAGPPHRTAGTRPAPRTATTPAAEPEPSLRRPHTPSPSNPLADEGTCTPPDASGAAGAASGRPGPSGRSPARPARPAHRDPNVLRWLTAYFASVVGDSVYFLALGWAAAQFAGPAQVGMVLAVGAVPRALLMLLGGVVADRFDPRKVVIGSDAMRAAVILALAAVLWLSTPKIWLLVVVALVFGVVDALFMPAVGALPPRLTAPDEVVRLVGMRQLAIRIGKAVGPPLAGFALAHHGEAAFATAGVLFAFSLLLLAGVRIAPLPADPGAAEPDTPWQDLADGLRYIRRHRLVGPLVLATALSEIGFMAPLQVGVFLLAGERGFGASSIGWILGAFAVGAGLGAVGLSLMGRIRRAGAVQVGTLVVASAAIGAIGLLPTVAGAATVAGFAGLVGGVCGGLSIALIQHNTAAAYQGRVAGVLALSHVGLAPLVFPLFGLAAGAVGVTPMFLIGAGVSASAAVVGLLSGDVRRAQLTVRQARGAGRPGTPAPAPPPATDLGARQPR
ncbi:MFS transporter [Streptomyces sp. NPDC060085]|uniref:MFS transporter n=1 Tax=Streptomyces sp. NPDC060085 TaxID=3347054 RepID=UPI003659DED9